MNNPSVINLQYTTIKDPLPDFIWEGLKEYSRNANLYQPQPEILIDKLAKKFKLPKKKFYLIVGVDEAIQMFALAYGKNAFVFVPAYVVYSDVEEFGGKLTRLYSFKGNEFVIDPREYKGATLIYLANPNNPSGYTPKEKVLELVKNNPQAIVVIDEAYAEFANLSVVNEIKKYPNMAILRSFSKSYGMAGNRIGFIVASPKIINVVKNKSQWSNVSYLSVGAAVTALNNENYFKKIRDGIGKRREEFSNFLNNLGFQVFPSKINAVLIKFKHEKKADDFVKYLGNNNIIVSQGNGNSNIGLDMSFVRIAIGNKEQMEKVKKVIRNINING